MSLLDHTQKLKRITQNWTKNTSARLRGGLCYREIIFRFQSPKVKCKNMSEIQFSSVWLTLITFTSFTFKNQYLTSLYFGLS
jgi:hypothetical protein